MQQTSKVGHHLARAVASKLWDIVEFLLDKGADPRKIYAGHNAFAEAAKVARLPWEETEDVSKYLSQLCDSDSVFENSDTPAVPD